MNHSCENTSLQNVSVENLQFSVHFIIKRRFPEREIQIIIVLCSQMTSVMNSPRPMHRERGQSTTIEWPCGVCGQESEDLCVCCDTCQKWIHYMCTGTGG